MEGESLREKLEREKHLPVEEADFRPLPGTTHAEGPDFSPDGEWIVYRDDEREALLKVPVAGGPPVPVMAVDSISPHAPHWGTRETIVFSGPTGVWVVSATGRDAPRLLST